jgi:hypothetical protein
MVALLQAVGLEQITPEHIYSYEYQNGQML